MPSTPAGPHPRSGSGFVTVQEGGSEDSSHSDTAAVPLLVVNGLGALYKVPVTAMLISSTADVPPR